MIEPQRPTFKERQNMKRKGHSVSRTSEIDMDRQNADIFEPSMQEISAAMAVRDLMSATSSLSEMAAGKSTAGLVRIEANDIELAYTRLGRMLSHIRARETV